MYHIKQLVHVFCDLLRDSINIEQVKEFYFLGLIIDANLNLRKHAENILNACSKKRYFK